MKAVALAVLVALSFIGCQCKPSIKPILNDRNYKQIESLYVGINCGW